MSVVLSEIKNNVGILTLNRPHKKNALNEEVAIALLTSLDEFDNQSEVRCVYITGAGDSFCSGQDLSGISKNLINEIQHILREHYNPLVTKIRTMQKPVIAAVNGIAAGAGASLALCCDIVIACRNASFIQAFSKIGLIPDSGSTYFLPRLIGFQKALALMLLADKITATEAAQMGMVYKVFEEDEFEQEAWKIALALTQMPTKALAYIKQALNKTFENDLTAQLQLEETLQLKAGSTEDFKEGIQAFLEKRKPHFKGK